jgi:DNA repair protein RecN (Recombination protein N)
VANRALGADGAQEPLGVALDTLRRLDVDDPALAELVTRANGLLAEAAELAADVRAYGEQVEVDPHRLAELQDRRHLLNQLMRKYGASITDVLAYADEARREHDRLVSDEADADELDRMLEEAEELVRGLAQDVRRGRRTAAEQLGAVIDGHLGELGMPHARCSIEVEPLPDEAVRADGGDRVTFLLAPNPGEPPRLIAQAASGGERSRVSLAIEVALADVDDARVLVFDEVDAGVGGATAMAVGEKLARLASGSVDGQQRQVLCVTHLAQLAAFADVHYAVEKGLAGGRTVTTTRQVAEDERPRELARMLGGDASAAAGLEHARELLDAARDRRAG